MNEQDYPITEEPHMRPTHPGDILRQDVRPALGLSVTEMARRLRVSRATLHHLLACDIGVSPKMALRLGKLCGNGPGLWLRMQADHDLWKAERALHDELALIETAPHDQAA
jgi:addiction module HigA family antidote